jgi:RAT1-interacting protein
MPVAPSGNVRADDGVDLDERPTKRARALSPKALHHATYSLPGARSQWPPTAFEQPQHLTSFSYSPTRELLLPSSGRANEALRFYAEPPLGADLNRGLAEAVMRKEGVAEGLDALLEWCAELGRDTAKLTAHSLLDTDETPASDSILLRASLITWRGMATRLCKAAFAARADDGWEMNAMMVDGVLYFEESISDAQQTSKGTMNDEQRRSTYYGCAQSDSDVIVSRQ